MRKITLALKKDQWFSIGVILPPCRQLTMSGYHFGCHDRLVGGYCYLVLGRRGVSKYHVQDCPHRKYQPQMLIGPMSRNSDTDDELERYLKQ